MIRFLTRSPNIRVLQIIVMIVLFSEMYSSSKEIVINLLITLFTLQVDFAYRNVPAVLNNQTRVIITGNLWTIHTKHYNAVWLFQKNEYCLKSKSRLFTILYKKGNKWFPLQIVSYSTYVENVRVLAIIRINYDVDLCTFKCNVGFLWTRTSTWSATFHVMFPNFPLLNFP